jgi:ABC-type sugar transport system substrate-binding protein
MVPANPDGLSESIRHVVDAGIPVYFSDGGVNGAENIISGEQICDNYSDGWAGMEFMAEKLNYKGNICLIKLDPQPAWKPRSDAAKDVIAKYPDMKIVGEWSWDPTGVNTPRQAMDGFLAANPAKGSIDGVWAAWDTACLEAIEACKAAGRTEIVFVGHDGGKEGIDMLFETNDQFIASIGPAPRTQCFNNVANWAKLVRGQAPDTNRYAFTVVLEKESLAKARSEGKDIYSYDLPGNAQAWGLPVVQHVDAPK